LGDLRRDQQTLCFSFFKAKPDYLAEVIRWIQSDGYVLSLFKERTAELYPSSAPRNFMRSIPQIYDNFSGRLQFFGFGGGHGQHDYYTADYSIASLPAKCNLTEAEKRHFELTNELPLAVPPCPDGLAEFAYAR
jgi:hypothetical protein